MAVASLTHYKVGQFRRTGSRFNPSAPLKAQLGSGYDVAEQSAASTATVCLEQVGSAMTFHVHGGGLVFSRSINGYWHRQEGHDGAPRGVEPRQLRAGLAGADRRSPPAPRSFRPTNGSRAYRGVGRTR
jgi:hypothetical protein